MATPVEPGSDHRQLSEEQAALRRVGALVASGAPPVEVFEEVAADVGRVLAVDASALMRYGPGGAVTVVGAWTVTGLSAPTALGSRLPLGGRDVTTTVFETGKPVRIEDDEVSGAAGTAAAHDRKVRLSLGVPINVAGRLWGVMASPIGSSRWVGIWC